MENSLVKHLHLPQLKDGHNVSSPKEPGLWENKDRVLLQSVAKGIEVDEAAIKRGVSSIPDMYARPMVFLSAFLKENHPLHKSVIREWRGLLSLLALHQVKRDLTEGLSFAFTQTDMGEMNTFKTTLNLLAPEPVALGSGGDKYTYTNFIIIKYKGKAIGGLSPSTLVYTAADIASKLPQEFPFSDGYGICPPKSTEDLRFLGEWLEWFQKKFEDLSNTSGNECKQAINAQLLLWTNEIRETLSIPEKEIIDSEGVKPGDGPSDNIQVSDRQKLKPIFSALLTPLINEVYTGNGSISDFALDLGIYDRKIPRYKEVVIVNENLLLKHQDKKLWLNLFVRELGENPIKNFVAGSGNKISNIPIGHEDAIWIRPEHFFFTDTLVKATKGHFIIPSENVKDEQLDREDSKLNYLLPLRSEVLEFFSLLDIRDRLQPDLVVRPDGSVQATITLELVGTGKLLVEKIYRQNPNKSLNEGLLLDMDPPVLEIFPNYLGKFWCQYYVLAGDTETLKVVPINFASKVQTERIEQSFDTNKERVKAEIIRITGYNSFPEGLEIQKRNGEPAGLILLPKDVDSDQRNFYGEVTVGVDFGTSNTNIFYFSSDKPEPAHFHFKKYIRQITDSEESKRKQLSELFFVPVENVKLPIPTALKVQVQGKQDNFLTDYSIYFPFGYKYPNNVRTDIKWDEDSRLRNAFLRSIFFLILVDQVQKRNGSIKLRYTYPKSFSPDRIMAYLSSWKQLIRSVIGQKDEPITQEILMYAENGMSEEPGRGEKYFDIGTSAGSFKIYAEPGSTTEGIAAGEYFSNPLINKKIPADKQNGAICIDVGGGTTDFSIWFENKIQYDASVLLAGRQISKFLRESSRLRSELFTPEASAALQEAKEDELGFSSRLNFILRKEQDLIVKNLGDKATNRDINEFRRFLAIEFGALAYYAGHLVLALNKKLGGNRLKDQIQKNGIHLHWGGNAAKFLSWIDFGQIGMHGISSKFLNDVFFHALKDKNADEFSISPFYENLKQNQSPGHKDEAAGGLAVIDYDLKKLSSAANRSTSGPISFVDDDEEFGSSNDDGGIVIGEHIQVAGREHKHFDEISKSVIFPDKENSSLFKETYLVQLDRFIKLVNAVGKETGLFIDGSQVELSTDQKHTIKTNILNKLYSEGMKDRDRITLEPIFIMEVRNLLEMRILS